MKPRSDITTRLRLASGLVLMAFVAGHLVNHALTLHSLEAVSAGRVVFSAVWRSLPGTILLYGALLIHIALSLFKLYQRRRLRMPLWEMGQIALGLAIPFWLVLHVLGTRAVHELFGVNDSYLLQFGWVWGGNASGMTIMLLLVWAHGCVGLHFWLRIRPWYAALRPYLMATALVMPVMALAGFHLGGREIQAIAEHDPNWLARIAAEQNWPDDNVQSWIQAWEGRVLGGLILLLAVVVMARMLRDFRERAAGQVEISYIDGSSVSIEPGMTVLDGSRLAGIAHAAVCGGRGRCSTCRVRIGAGADHLPPPADDELKVLNRIGASDRIRLACQLRPMQALEVAPLLPATAGPASSRVQVDPAAGVEREVAVLFADLRAFTRMAEGRLPFDVVFILNQYFKAMGAAIEDTGGRVDKFIGDGIMALFGIDAAPSVACRQSLLAAKAMAHRLEDLNQDMKADLPEPLRIGMGLHVGPVILGEMGYHRATSLTAIGDPVNVASRLETLTKDFNAQLVVSAHLARRAGLDLGAFESQDIDIRGRQRPLRVHIVADAASLPGSNDEWRQSTMPRFSMSSLFQRIKR